MNKGQDYCLTKWSELALGGHNDLGIASK
jgi:hypothetical protein